MSIEPPLASAQITGGGTEPSTAVAIMVRALLPYTTFTGQLIGQKNLQAQAQAVASQITTAWSDSVMPSNTTIWMNGPSGCADTLIIASGGNSNSTDLGGYAFINGNGTLGSGNSNQGLYDNGHSSGVANFTGSAGTLANNTSTSQYANSASNPYSPAQAYPDYFYVTLSDGTKHLITAEDFRPTSDEDSSSPWLPASYPHNYIVEEYVNHHAPLGVYYHYVTGTSSSNTASVNGAALTTALKTNQPGIYFVDGNVQIQYLYHSYGQGVAATGKIEIAAGTGSTRLGSANNALGWGWNLSVISGYQSADSQAACANGTGTGHYDPAIYTSSQQSMWDNTAIAYAPYGAIAIADNSNGGHNMGPAFATSLTTGTGGNANNIQFQACPSCWTRIPNYTFGLNY
jgi:hypothetical protein